MPPCRRQDRATLPDPNAFSIDLEGGGRLDVVLERTARGPVVHAEERIDGRVVGTISAGRQALQPALGLAQRAFQPEHGVRDRPASEAWRMRAATRAAEGASTAPSEEILP